MEQSGDQNRIHFLEQMGKTWPKGLFPSSSIQLRRMSTLDTRKATSCPSSPQDLVAQDMKG